MMYHLCLCRVIHYYCMFELLIFDMLVLFLFFFFFKQKTAYEMRISDWSSDVCSSDLSYGASFSNWKCRTAHSRSCNWRSSDNRHGNQRGSRGKGRGCRDRKSVV